MRYGAKILFKNVTLQFNAGNRYGLIGANGCGKSTLIRILTGEITPEHGEVTLPQEMRVGSLSQDHYLFKGQNVLDVVLQGNNQLWLALEKKSELLKKDCFDAPECELLSQLETIIDEQGGYASEGEAAKLLEGLGISAERHRQSLDLLSGGYKLRVLLAQVLFGKPEILVLDEPTNHLDLYSIKWLEDYLRNFPGMLIIASHDREFLNGICTHIADVDYGTIKIYNGNYNQFQEQKKVDRELKVQIFEKHEKKRSDLQGFIDRFGAKATKARQAKSKARIVEQIEEEMESIDLSQSSRIYPNISFQPLRSSGVSVLKVNELCKSFGEKKVLDRVSFEIERGEKVAIIGPNGIGKSTLLEIINEHIPAEGGEFQWGFSPRISYFPQDHGREVKGSLSLLDWLGQFDREIPQEKLRDLLGKVLFSGDVVNQSVQTLSGGEMARLILAKMMLQKPNILIFDEPTNHLDMEAIEELVRALESFQGTLIFVSHNRYFVSLLANRIVEITSREVKNFKGTYAEYLSRQENDFLSSHLPLSRRNANEQTSSNKSVRPNSSYEDQKRLKSQLAQLKKKVDESEAKCNQLEQKLEEIHVIMSTEGYYIKASQESIQSLLNEKAEIEERLMHALADWEKAGLDLQSMELCQSQNISP